MPNELYTPEWGIPDTKADVDRFDHAPVVGLWITRLGSAGRRLRSIHALGQPVR